MLLRVGLDGRLHQERVPLPLPCGARKKRCYGTTRETLAFLNPEPNLSAWIVRVITVVMADPDHAR